MRIILHDECDDYQLVPSQSDVLLACLEFRQKPLVIIDHCSFLSLPCMLSAHFFDKVFLTLCPVVHRTKEVATRELRCAELTAAHFKLTQKANTYNNSRKPVAVIVLLFTFPYLDKATATNNKK